MFYRSLVLSIIALTLSACNISGSAQKGPFKKNSPITITPLNNQAEPLNARSVTSKVRTAQGNYSVSNIKWNGWTELKVSGQYFNEFSGVASTDSMTLKAITKKDRSFDVANIHLFSHLAVARINQRVVNGETQDSAWKNTQVEMKELFGLERVSVNYHRGVEQLSLTRGTGTFKNDNANLLLFTGSFLATNGDAGVLALLTEDFADDGQFNGVGQSAFSAISVMGRQSGLLTILSQNLKNNGAYNPPNDADMPELPSWVAQEFEDNTPPEITITGQNPITIEVGSNYIDQGATATDDVDGSVSVSVVDNSDIIDTSEAATVTVTYKAVDNAGNEALATRTVTIVDADNLAPVATAQTVDVAEDSTNSQIVLTATDGNGDALTYSITVQPTKGVLSGDVLNLTYTPEANYNGSDSFSFTANDGEDTSAPAEVTVNVTPVNDAPTANAGDDISVEINNSVTLVGNGSDIDGDPLSFSWRENGVEIATIASFTYIPTTGGVHTLTLSVSDGTKTTVDTVEITATLPPVHQIVLVTNQTDAPRNSDANLFNQGLLALASIKDANGSVVAGAVPTFDSTSVNLTTLGAYELVYSFTDSYERTITKSLTVNVINTAPEADTGALTTNEDIAKAITLTGSDANGDTLTYSITAQPTKGVISGSAPNITYTPDDNFYGEDSFSFSVDDGSNTENSTATATVNITVNRVNDLPTVSAGDDIEVRRGEIITINGTAEDLDGSITSYRWTGTGIDSNFEYATTASFDLDTSRKIIGSFYLQLTVTDNEEATASSQVKVTVLPALTEPAEMILNFTLPLTIKADKYADQNELYDFLKTQISVLDHNGDTHQGGNDYELTFDGYSGVGSDTGNWESFDPTVVGVGQVQVSYKYQGEPVLDDQLFNVVISLPEPYVIASADEPLIVTQGASQSEFEEMLFGNAKVQDVDGNDVIGATVSQYTGTVDLNQAGSHSITLTYTDRFERTVTKETQVLIEAVVIADSFVIVIARDTSGNRLNDVLVQVIDEAGEAVTYPGSDDETSWDGLFLLLLPAESNFTLKFTRDDLATQVLPIKTPAAEDEGHDLNVTLIPRALPQAIPEKGEVIGSDGAKVIIQDNTFVDAQGNPVLIADGITVTITPVDVSTPVGVAAFPGEFSGIPEGQDTASPIVSYGTVEYVFRDSSGNELQLASEQLAIIEIPLFIATHQDGTTVAVDDLIPLWSLDELTGIWTQEGAGIVVASAASPTGFALNAEVSHFTWWNADAVMNPAFAQVTVTAPEGGTALIKIRTTGNVNGWRSDSVNTVIAVGDSTGLLPIPSNTEVCFWAEVSFTSEGSATTNESCATAQPGEAKSISLDVISAPLQLKATPSATVNTYINVAPLPVKVSPSTFVVGTIDYSLEGSLPTGVSFDPSTAVISGVPTEAGDFSFTVKGVDADRNESTVLFTYMVIDGLAAPNLQAGFINYYDGTFSPFDEQRPSNTIRTYDFSDGATGQINTALANNGGNITSWSIEVDPSQMVQMGEIVVNNNGYFLFPVGSVSVTEFDVSIDANTGVVTVVWPMSYIQDVDYRIDFDALAVVVTGTNDSGSSTRTLNIIKTNGNPAKSTQHGTGIDCDALTNEDIGRELMDLYSLIDDLNYDIAFLIGEMGRDENDPEVVNLQMQISDYQEQIDQLEDCESQRL